jgi:CRP/FNR family transcriptional regulator, cyclic AMP receptor protein
MSGINVRSQGTASENSNGSKGASAGRGEPCEHSCMAEGANKLESLLVSWNIPLEVAKELTEYHTKVNYTPGALIFGAGAPADILFWVIKGIVKVSCPRPDGTSILMRLAATGEVLGLCDELNCKGRWVRRFEAQAMTRCVLAMVTRQHVRSLLKNLDSSTVLDVSERMNSTWAGWVHYYAWFLGLSFQQRLEMVLVELARKFGVEDRDGILLTFEPGHADLAEMIGSSRPMVSRLMAELTSDGEVARRGRSYLLLRAGTLAGRLALPPMSVARAESESRAASRPPVRPSRYSGSSPRIQLQGKASDGAV